MIKSKKLTIADHLNGKPGNQTAKRKHDDISSSVKGESHDITDPMKGESKGQILEVPGYGEPEITNIDNKG